jgi:hypothetical protein
MRYLHLVTTGLFLLASVSVCLALDVSPEPMVSEIVSDEMFYIDPQGGDDAHDGLVPPIRPGKRCRRPMRRSRPVRA